jgi:hypothetical protein
VRHRRSIGRCNSDNAWKSSRVGVLLRAVHFELTHDYHHVLGDRASDGLCQLTLGPATFLVDSVNENYLCTVVYRVVDRLRVHSVIVEVGVYRREAGLIGFRVRADR